MLDDTNDTVGKIAEGIEGVALMEREGRRIGKIIAAAVLRDLAEQNIEVDELDEVAKAIGVDENFGTARALLHSLAVGKADEVTLGEIAFLVSMMGGRIGDVAIFGAGPFEDDEGEEGFEDEGPLAPAEYAADEAAGEDRGH